MMNQAAAVNRPAVMKRLLKRIEDEAGMCRPAGAPADDPAGIAIIQRYEQEVLKKQLGTFRLQVDAPSRTKRKDRPTNVELPFVEVDDRRAFVRDLGSRSFSFNDAPLILNLWQLPEPRLFRLSGSRMPAARFLAQFKRKFFGL